MKIQELELNVYKNKMELLYSVHSHLYTPFTRYENDHVSLTFVVWNKSWCELAVHALMDTEWGLSSFERTRISNIVRFG